MKSITHGIVGMAVTGGAVLALKLFAPKLRSIEASNPIIGMVVGFLKTILDGLESPTASASAGGAPSTGE